MDTESKFINDIKHLIHALTKSKNEDDLKQYLNVSGTQIVSEAKDALKQRDPEDFFYSFSYKIQQAVDGMLESELKNDSAVFLFSHSDFVDTNLTSLFSRFEGHACSADKARTVIRSLARHFVDGKPIEFDYEAEITFHLPKTILTTEKDVLGYFRALCMLYYGDFMGYTSHLKTVIEGWKGNGHG